MSFNKITIVGNLGRDPELRYTPQGSAVCSFSMATTEKRRDKNGEMADQTTWFKVTLWEKRAETASKYLTKGSQVYIEGRLRTEEWTDKDGKTRTSLEVLATEMQFIGTKGGGMPASTGGDDSTFDNAPMPVNNAPAGDDDIPF
jgi:single-strand DNA-binding protein